MVCCYVFLHLSQSLSTEKKQSNRYWTEMTKRAILSWYLVSEMIISVWRSNVTSFMYVSWLSQSFNTFFPPTSVTLRWHEAANELTAKTRSNTFLSNAIDTVASTSEQFPSTSMIPDLCRKYRNPDCNSFLNNVENDFQDTVENIRVNVLFGTMSVDKFLRKCQKR